MFRWFLVATLSAGLLGCSHYFDVTADDFQRGKAPRTVFERDNYDCAVNASVVQNRAGGGGGDPVGIYNDAYSRCMEAHGHPEAGFNPFGVRG